MSTELQIPPSLPDGLKAAWESFASGRYDNVIEQCTSPAVATSEPYAPLLLARAYISRGLRPVGDNAKSDDQLAGETLEKVGALPLWVVETEKLHRFAAQKPDPKELIAQVKALIAARNVAAPDAALAKDWITWHSTARADLLHAIAATRGSQFAEADLAFAAAEALFRSNRDRVGLAETAVAQGQSWSWRGNQRRSGESLSVAQNRWALLGNTVQQALATHELAVSLRDARRYETAITLLEDVAAILKSSTANPSHVARTEQALATAYVRYAAELDEHEREVYLKDCEALVRPIEEAARAPGDYRATMARIDLVLVEQVRENHAAARTMLRKAIRNARKMNEGAVAGAWDDMEIGQLYTRFILASARATATADDDFHVARKKAEKEASGEPVNPELESRRRHGRLDDKADALRAALPTFEETRLSFLDVQLDRDLAPDVRSVRLRHMASLFAVHQLPSYEFEARLAAAAAQLDDCEVLQAGLLAHGTSANAEGHKKERDLRNRLKNGLSLAERDSYAAFRIARLTNIWLATRPMRQIAGRISKLQEVNWPVDTSMHRIAFRQQRGAETSFNAWDAESRSDVVVKILDPAAVSEKYDRAGDVAALKEIAESSHLIPGIPTFLKDQCVFPAEGKVSEVRIVTEAIRGKSLLELIHDGLDDPWEAVRIASQIAWTIDDLHKYDLPVALVTPAAVWLEPWSPFRERSGKDPKGQKSFSGSSLKRLGVGFPVIVSFGVLQRGSGALGDDYAWLGDYAPPEMKPGFGKTKLDSRSDVYMIGALLAQLLTGDPKSRRKEVKRALESRTELRKQDLRPITDVVAKCLHPDRGARYKTAGEAALAIEKLAAFF